MLMKKFFYLVMLLTILGSCQKDEIHPSANPATIRPNDLVSNQINEPTFEGTEQIQALEVEDQGTEKIASSSILNATNASQIPSQMFAVNPIYKTAYIHMGQPDVSSCSWTSYMLAVGSIARGNGKSYECSADKVYRIKNKCLEISSSKPSLITTLQSFGNTYDSQYILAVYQNGAKNANGRFDAIKKMLAHINSYRTPFLVIGTYYYTDGRKVAHYLVVHSIDWKVGGTGSTVYYTDCGYGCVNNNCSITSNLKSMSLTTFLDRMVEKSDQYNMLFLRPN